MKPTYEQRLYRNGDLARDGDLVVILEGPSDFKGTFGVLGFDEGYETVRITNGCSVKRMHCKDLRKASSYDTVAA